MTYTKPLPPLTTLNSVYLSGAAEGELRLQRCGPCGHIWFPPASRCPACLSAEWTFTPVSGRATLWSWIVMHQKYFQSFADDLPYVVAVVELAEGPRMISTIVGTPAQDLRCDLELRAVFERVEDGVGIVKFRVSSDE